MNSPTCCSADMAKAAGAKIKRKAGSRAAIKFFIFESPCEKTRATCRSPLFVLAASYALRLPRLLQRPQHVLWAQRQFVDPHSCRVEDRVGDAGHGWDAGDFTGAFGAVGTRTGVAGHQGCFDARHHVDGWHQVIDE